MFKRVIATLSLCLLALPALAAPVTYPEIVQDTSGNRVAGATLAVGGTTLVADTPTTVTGQNLSTGTNITGLSVTYHDFGNGFYSLKYDPAGTDTYFALTVSKSGSTFANSGTVDLICTVDPQNVATAATQATAAATSSTANGLLIAALPTASAISTSVWSAGTRNLTGLGFTLSPVTVGGYSTGQDPATLIKADSVLARTFNRSKGSYTYNLTTHVQTLLNDDGTTYTPVTLTVDPTTGTITGRQ